LALAFFKNSALRTSIGEFLIARLQLGLHGVEGFD
jgi:hypothetical protein